MIGGEGRVAGREGRGRGKALAGVFTVIFRNTKTSLAATMFTST